MYSLPFFGVTGGGQTLPIVSLYDYLDSLSPDTSILPTLYEYLDTLNPPEVLPTLYEYLDTLSPDTSQIPSVFEYLDNATTLTFTPNYLTQSLLTTSNLDFTFTLKRVASRNVVTTVSYQVAGYGTSAALAQDFVGGSFPFGTLTYQPGETEKTITVSLLGNPNATAPKRFRVELTGFVDSDNGINIGGDPATGLALGDVNSYLISLNTQVWLDAADSSSLDFVASSNQVSQWNDKSTFNRNFVQVTAANQPLYQQKADLKRLPSISFDGINDRVSTASTVVVPVPNPLGSTVFAVWRINNTNLSGTFNPIELANIVKIDATLTNLGFTAWPDSGTTTITPAQSVTHVTTTHLLDIAYLGQAANSNQNYIVHRNGQRLSITERGTGITRNSSFMTVGMANNGTGFANMDCQELIVFPRALEQVDREVLQGHLAHKWSLTGELNADHTYKVNPPFSRFVYYHIEANNTNVVFVQVNTTTSINFTVTRVGDLNVESSVSYVVTGSETVTNSSNPATANMFSGGQFPSGILTFSPGEFVKTLSIPVLTSYEVLTNHEFTVTLSNPTSPITPVNSRILVDKAISRFRWDYDSHVSLTRPLIWLDAADDTRISRTGTTISTWFDKSINQNNFLGTEGTRPEYQKLLVRFTTTNFLFIDNKRIFDDTKEASIFFVGGQPTATAGGWGRFSSNTTTNRTVDSFGRFSESFLSTTQVSPSPVITYPMSFSIINFDKNNTELTIRRNGLFSSTSLVTYGIPEALSTNQRIGGMGGDFDHREILVFSRILTENERLFVEGYLAWKWGLVQSLPTNHPYREVPPFNNFIAID